ncbi:hypothetical protein FRB90_007487 [Tulasnella sp. 427]|nr:hypothetical protein FRB90_007487 [Tulasnella sp. 427]
MFTWIASFFRPAEQAAHQQPADLEAGFKPKPLQTASTASPTSSTPTKVKKTAAPAPLPFASRTVNFFYEVFTRGRPDLLWRNAKYYFNTGSLYLARKRAAFEACNFGLLTAMCYPDADHERFRVLCDYINCLFAFDDLTDEGGLRKDGSGTKKASDIIMNALAHPFSFETEFRCGRVFASFWGRAVELGCSVGTQRRFLEYTDLYVQAVHEQVLHRARNYIPPLEEFIRLRRDTGALKMCFAMGEFGLNVDIPDVVFECPLIRIMEDCSNDVVVLSNDIYSYNIEQAQGDTCNIIEAAMKEKGLNVQGAMDYAGELVKGRIDLYTASKAQLPSWGPKVDADVQRYLRVLEDWMTGGFYWSLESKRYFGDQVDRVKKTLCVEILPKEAPRGQIVIPDLDRAT